MIHLKGATKWLIRCTLSMTNNMLRNTNVTFFKDDRDQVKDVERLLRKALYLGYSSKPINNCKIKQYNGMTSECEDT